jgi:hypothetical protein
MLLLYRKGRGALYCLIRLLAHTLSHGWMRARHYMLRCSRL